VIATLEFYSSTKKTSIDNSILGLLCEVHCPILVCFFGRFGEVGECVEVKYMINNSRFKRSSSVSSLKALRPKEKD
jgi:hypothetical protein